MYASVYSYAADPSYWTTQMPRSDGQDYRLATTSNWMYMGVYEWIILRNSDYTTNSFYVDLLGYVGYNNVSTYFDAVRPVFYLSSSVVYDGGTGEMNSPIRLSL